jgi:hypothetical protein
MTEPASQQPGTHLRIKRMVVDAEPEPDAPSRGRRLLHTVLWIALVAWLAALAFYLLDPLPLLFPDPDAALEWQAPAAAQTIIRTREPAPRPTEPESRELQALKRRLADLLLDGDYAAAMEALRRQREAPDLYPHQDAIVTLAAFVREVSAVNSHVADAFSSRLDESVVVRVRDRRLTLIPRARAGERINAFVPTDGGTSTNGQSVTFNVTDLDPAERAHWLGEAATPEICAMKLLLHAQAGDITTARTFVDGCGPMAAAFRDALAGRQGTAAAKPRA